jgi:Tfp pilus assembly PilM family ATPase
LTAVNDINSTEKLLDVIRGKKSDSIEEVEKAVDTSSKKQKAPKFVANWSKIFSEKKIYTIGVDISHENILLSKTIRTADGKPVLVAYKVVEYNSLTAKESTEFKTILKSSLLSFCGNTVNCNIWALISDSEVNVHHIKIPRVAKKQLENIIYWTAKKENVVEDKDFIFDFEMQGEFVDQGIPKYSVMVYSASNAEVGKVKNLFSGIGVTLAGITMAPFAIQNIIRKKWMPAGEVTIASLFIDNDFSRIDIFNKGNLVMTRGIKTGITSMMEAVAETINERDGALRLGKDEARKILFSINPDAEKLKETDAGFGLKAKEIYEMVLPVVERLVRQVERTLEHFTSTGILEKVEKIYISSSMDLYEPIIHYISEQLGIKSEIFDPFKKQEAYAAIKSLSLAERMFLVPALGLSFSDNYYTPNVIFTYKQKNREININRLNRGIFAAFGLALVVCLTTLAYQGFEAKKLSNKVVKLENDISRYKPLLTTEAIEKMAAEVAVKRQDNRRYADRYTQLAVIGEISDITLPQISLFHIKISLAGPVKDKAEKTQKDADEGVVLEGVVFGERSMLDSLLTQYVVKLEYSPMLRQVTVGKSNIVKFRNTEVLQFTLNAKIG